MASATATSSPPAAPSAPISLTPTRSTFAASRSALLAQPWGEDRDADRRTLRRCIGTLQVSRADGRRGWQPLDERVSLTWADGSLPQVA